MDSQAFKFSKNPIIFWVVSMPCYLWQIFVGESLRLYHLFSIPELLRTLFAPWKRDEIATEDLALSDKLQVFAGNMASRFIAFIIRTMTIFTGMLCIGFWFILGLVLIVAQVILPIWVILLLVFRLRMG